MDVIKDPPRNLKLRAGPTACEGLPFFKDAMLLRGSLVLLPSSIQYAASVLQNAASDASAFVASAMADASLTNRELPLIGWLPLDKSRALRPPRDFAGKQGITPAA